MFFSQEEGWPLPEKTLEGDHRCCKKALHPKHYAEVLATEGNSWRAAADEEEEEEEQQQEDTEDSGGESGDDKCMVCCCFYYYVRRSVLFKIHAANIEASKFFVLFLSVTMENYS